MHVRIPTLNAPYKLSTGNWTGHHTFNSRDVNSSVNKLLQHNAASLFMKNRMKKNKCTCPGFCSGVFSRVVDLKGAAPQSTASPGIWSGHPLLHELRVWSVLVNACDGACVCYTWDVSCVVSSSL